METFFMGFAAKSCGMQRPSLTLKFAPFGRWDAPSARPLASHVGAGNGFADDCGIGSVVLAAFAAHTHTVGHHKLRRHHAHGVTKLGKFTGPVVRA